MSATRSTARHTGASTDGGGPVTSGGARAERIVGAGSDPDRPRRGSWVLRYLHVPDSDGPRVRLGLLWFALVVAATAYSAPAAAALFAVVGTVAALQSSQAWRFGRLQGGRRLRRRASRSVAAGGAAALPVAALFGPQWPGAVVLAVVVAALLVALIARLASGRRRPTPVLVAAATTVFCALPPGLAGAGVVLTRETDLISAVLLVVLVSAFDAGYFLFAAEGRSLVLAILAGMAGTFAVTAVIWAFQVGPYGASPAAWVYGGMVAAVAPLGQVFASVSLPDGDVLAPALRRIDAYVLAAPLWVLGLWSYLA